MEREIGTRGINTLGRQRGQAFVLVLILLALGSLVIVPALNLSFTGLQSRQAQQARLMEYYAADGAQEYSVWRLANEPGFASTLEPGVKTGPYYIELNGVKAEYSVTAQASETAPSDAPITNDRYKITANVTPDYLPEEGLATEFIYTITLQSMFDDVPADPFHLTELRVNFPQKFDYLDDSATGFITQGTLSTPGSDFRWTFTPGISFNFWERKTMTFRASTTFTKSGSHYTGVEAWIEQGGRSGSTGATAPIVVVISTAGTEIPKLAITKTVEPSVIPPGENITLAYTITLKNLSSFTPIDVKEIRDALPAGFSYVAESSSGILDNPPAKIEPVGAPVAGGTRWRLEWSFTPAPFLTIDPGESVTGTFQARGIVDSSGTFANEVWITTSPAIAEAYSWPTGMVTVPHYDVESSAGSSTIRVVFQISEGRYKVRSWQVDSSK